MKQLLRSRYIGQVSLHPANLFVSGRVIITTQTQINFIYKPILCVGNWMVTKIEYDCPIMRVFNYEN